MQLGEGQVFQLVLDLGHADPLGQRRIDLHGFQGDALALFRITDVVQGPHVVGAVGQLDQQDTNVL